MAFLWRANGGPTSFACWIGFHISAEFTFTLLRNTNCYSARSDIFVLCIFVRAHKHECTSQLAISTPLWLGNIGNRFSRWEAMGPKLQCLLKVEKGLKVLIFKDAKNNVSNLLNRNSFIFSVDHNDILDHKYCIDPGNLLNI